MPDLRTCIGRIDLDGAATLDALGTAVTLSEQAHRPLADVGTEALRVPLDRVSDRWADD